MKKFGCFTANSLLAEGFLSCGLADGYIVRAREFWTTWRRFMEDFGSPFKIELQ